MRFICFILFFIFAMPAMATDQQPLCLDGFCIGQSIQEQRFDNTNWIIPKKDFVKEQCHGVGCKPEIAWHGYPGADQQELAETFSWFYGAEHYNVIENSNLGILRRYKYECNLSARGGLQGERRLIGIYQSTPSHYLTIVGLRLIDGDLKVYRIARRYPYQNQNELISLAKELHGQYGRENILFYDHLSSNAYSDVIKQNKNGWFGRSEMFNPSDLSDNYAELVLIDPSTRPLLEPTSMPESGDIKSLAVRPSEQCNRPMPVQ